jgi:hypothetical protein
MLSNASSSMLSGGRPAHPITGRGGKSIDAVWAQGPQTYLGLTVAGFANMFLVTGPGSPSVLSNMTVSIEQHVDWVVDRLMAMRATGFSTIEATETAQAGWTAGAAAGRGLECRRQHRCRDLPAGARPRRAGDRRPAAGLPGHRRHARAAFAQRERDGLFPDTLGDVLVLDLYCAPADRRALHHCAADLRACRRRSS